MSDQSKVLRTAQKLLALAQGKGTTEAEAALAAEHVQRLLQEHGLTMAQLEADSGDDGKTAKREKNDAHAAMYTYQQNVMGALAEGNFCLHLIRKVFVPNVSWGAATGRDPATGEHVNGVMSKRHVLIGRELNVRVTIQTYEYLMAEIARLCPYDHRSTDGKRFLEGASVRIAERLNDRRREREAESRRKADEAKKKFQDEDTSRALVLTDVYGTEADLNNDALNDFPPGTTAAKRREAENRRLARVATRDRLVAEGMNHLEATYRSWGYDDATVERLMKATKRRGSGRRGRGRTQNWTRGNDRHAEKINSAAYQAGKAAGSRVGLDDQVGGSARRRIGSS